MRRLLAVTLMVLGFGCGQGICPPSSSSFVCALTGDPGSAAAIISPSSISGLELWLRAEDLALSDNDPVSTWTDLSTHGRNATQGTANLQPVYKTSILNGRPVVRFSAVPNGQEDYMAGSSPSLTDFTVYMVAKWNSGTSSDAQIFSLGSGGGAFTVSSTSNMVTITRDTDSPTFSDLSVLDGQFQILGIWYSALGGHSAAKNANNSSHSGLLSGRPPTGANYRVGANAAPNFMLDGDIAEILVYSSELSGSQRSDLFRYLNSRYAVY
jgi:hypothetical protein